VTLPNCKPLGPFSLARQSNMNAETKPAETKASLAIVTSPPIMRASRSPIAQGHAGPSSGTHPLQS